MAMNINGAGWPFTQVHHILHAYHTLADENHTFCRLDKQECKVHPRKVPECDTRSYTSTGAAAAATLVYLPQLYS